MYTTDRVVRRPDRLYVYNWQSDVQYITDRVVRTTDRLNVYNWQSSVNNRRSSA